MKTAPFFFFVCLVAQQFGFAQTQSTIAKSFNGFISTVSESCETILILKNGAVLKLNRDVGHRSFGFFDECIIFENGSSWELFDCKDGELYRCEIIVQPSSAETKKVEKTQIIYTKSKGYDSYIECANGQIYKGDFMEVNDMDYLKSIILVNEPDILGFLKAYIIGEKKAITLFKMPQNQR